MKLVILTTKLQGVSLQHNDDDDDNGGDVDVLCSRWPRTTVDVAAVVYGTSVAFT